MEAQESFHHALKIKYDLCIGCSHCTECCPTAAIHIENGHPVFDDNRCIDCGHCYLACPVHAIYIEQDDFQTIYNYKVPVLLCPSIFGAQFPDKIKEKEIVAAISDLGFRHIYEVEQSVDVIKQLLTKKMQDPDKEMPVISSFCPAIVRLIQVKFPSLVGNLMLTKPPLDLTALYIKKHLVETQGIAPEDIGIFYVAPCAAKIAAVKSPVGDEKSPIDGVINMNYLYNKVLRRIKQGNCPPPPADLRLNILSRDALLWALTDGEISLLKHGRNLAIDDVHNVSTFLEKLENEDIDDIDFLELRACDQSCAGGILCANNRFLIVEKQKYRAEKSPAEVTVKENGLLADADYLEAHSKVGKVEPRSMDKLDNDISVAMRKMEKAVKINKHLPQIDCRMCGYQSCKEFSLAVGSEKTDIKRCVFIQRILERNSQLSTEEALQIAYQIWGTDKFNPDNIADLAIE